MKTDCFENWVSANWRHPSVSQEASVYRRAKIDNGCEKRQVEAEPAALADYRFHLRQVDRQQLVLALFSADIST